MKEDEEALEDGWMDGYQQQEISRIVLVAY